MSARALIIVAALIAHLILSPSSASDDAPVATATVAAADAQTQTTEDAMAAEVTAADRAYGEGFDAYQRALIADGAADRATAVAALAEARHDLDAAIAGYRRILERDPHRDGIAGHLVDAGAVGAVCCGKTSMWQRYAAPAASVATPAAAKEVDATAAH